MHILILMKIVGDLKICDFIQKIIKIFNIAVFDILCYSWLTSFEYETSEISIHDLRFNVIPLQL